MDLLFWVTVGFIITGFIVLVSMKKGMESKVAYIKANIEDEGNSSKAKSVIWWIWSTVAWSIVSMFLVAWCFRNYFG